MNRIKRSAIKKTVSIKSLCVVHALGRPLGAESLEVGLASEGVESGMGQGEE